MTANWRLALPGRDYPLGSSGGRESDPLYAWVRSMGIGPKHPAVIRCDKCGVYSNIWGMRQANGFSSVHAGEGHSVSLEMKSRRKR